MIRKHLAISISLSSKAALKYELEMVVSCYRRNSCQKNFVVLFGWQLLILRFFHLDVGLCQSSLKSGAINFVHRYLQLMDNFIRRLHSQVRVIRFLLLKLSYVARKPRDKLL